MLREIFKATAAAIVIATALAAYPGPAAADQEAALNPSVPAAERVRDAIVDRLWYGRFRFCGGTEGRCNSINSSLRFSGDQNNLEVTLPGRGGPKKVPARIDQNGNIFFTTPLGGAVMLTLQPNGTELSGGIMMSGASYSVDGTMEFTLVD